MPSDDREVFAYIMDLKDTSREVAFLTYAIYAFERSEWVKHFHSRNNKPPQSQEIDDWISNLTEYQFSGMRERAVNMFDEAARDYLSGEILAADERAMNTAIVGQVKAAGGFWKQLAMALVTSILAPVLLGVIIAAALLADRGLPTISGIADYLGKRREMTGDASGIQPPAHPSTSPARGN